MRPLTIALVLVVAFSALPIYGSDKSDKDVNPTAAVGQNNTTERDKIRKQKARNAFIGNDSKIRNDTELDNMKMRLQKIGEKVKKEQKGKEPSLVGIPKNPTYDKRREGEPLSIEQTNDEAGLTDYLFEADILLMSDQLAQLEQDTATGRRKRGATTNLATKWPTSAKGVIPYTLDASLTAAKKAVIAEAIKFWETNACLKFQLNGAGTNRIQFFNGGGCWSYIGMVGGLQQISIGDGCQYLGIVTHEIMHALGFYHEQSRTDRNSYVGINLANVLAGYEGNFGLVSATNNYGVPYEYGSIMHYSSDSFAKNASVPTIVATNSLFQQTMGQRKGPTFFDVLGLNYFYNCTGYPVPVCPPTATLCKNGGYPNPKNCAVCVCPSGFSGTLCTTVQAAENSVCGGSLSATTAWKSLSATVGTTSTTDAQQSCYWHITSPANTKIEAKITALSGACSKGCFWNAVELKMGTNFQEVGYRHCCATDKINYVYTSAKNLVPVIVYGNSQISFTIQYRYVAASG